MNLRKRTGAPTFIFAVWVSITIGLFYLSVWEGILFTVGTLVLATIISGLRRRSLIPKSEGRLTS